MERCGACGHVSELKLVKEIKVNKKTKQQTVKEEYRLVGEQFVELGGTTFWIRRTPSYYESDRREASLVACPVCGTIKLKGINKEQ